MREHHRRLSPLRTLEILEASERDQYSAEDRYQQLRAAMFEHARSFHNPKRKRVKR